MSRNLARRGASVLVAAALLGGGLALGGGSASAQEASGGAIGSVQGTAAGSADLFGSPADWLAWPVLAAGVASGSIDEGDLWQGCAPRQDGCPLPPPTTSEQLTAWVLGIPPAVAFPNGVPREHLGS